MSEPAVPLDPARPRLADVLTSQRRALAATAIEQAALDLCVTTPLQDLTADHIAAAAGVSVRTFYRYFPSKEDILAALPLRRARQAAALLAARPAAEAPFEALRNAIVQDSPSASGELPRWQQAIATSHASERIEQLAIAVTGPVLTVALAERAGLPGEALWAQVAGAAAAAAMVIGARRWALEGGSLEQHLLAAVDIIGAGLAATGTGGTGSTNTRSDHRRRNHEGT